MSRRRVGLWLVGAYGGVGTTITIGLLAIKRGLIDRTGLVTAHPAFEGLSLPEPGDFVIGGHEIRQTSFEESAEEFRQSSGVFDASWIAACRDDLAAASREVQPAPRFGLGAAISRLATAPEKKPCKTAREAIDLVKSDIDSFAKRHALDHLIVLNVASTEAPFPAVEAHKQWEALQAALVSGGEELLPSSSLYAVAAVESGHSYVNFTPSLGATIPAVEQLAKSTGSLLAGKDGKTGETLMKTVLAPMFEHRNLRVQSWVGHNIFGNRDGQVLDDPTNKRSKVETKDRVITEILGYKPTSLVTIEYIPDMGDWKTAWDHIHFQGFLGTKMTLQFTWQGCDSLLAAPLGIDLVRLTDFEKQRGGKGLQTHLSCFFKSPEGVAENDFFKQWDQLIEYVNQAKA